MPQFQRLVGVINAYALVRVKNASVSVLSESNKYPGTSWR